jgi:hypothetical protein
LLLLLLLQRHPRVAVPAHLLLQLLLTWRALLLLLLQELRG